MGAEVFLTVGFCDINKKPQDAFTIAVQDAQYEHGHGGYTGTIAEKDSFTMIPLPADAMDQGLKDCTRLIEAACDGDNSTNNPWIASADRRVGDKWGPAGCSELRSKAFEEARGHLRLPADVRIFIFFGWASS